MSEAADGRPSFVVSVAANGAGGSPLVEKRGLDPRSAELLRYERAVLAQVSHPNIVEPAAVRSSGSADEPPALVTFLAGRSTLADHPPTDVAAVTRAAAQLATTLAELHGLGWAHGDLLAEHCIVAPDGGLVLCSFRKATPISSPSAPAAVHDVEALVALISTLVPESPARRGATRDLTALLAAARHRAVTARHLANELAALLGDRSTRRRSRPRPAPRRQPHRARHRRRSLLPGVVARLAACVLAAALLWWLDPAPAHQVASADDLAPALRLAAETVRWAGLVAAVYGVVIGGLTLAALLSRSARLAAAAERCGPSLVRRWATGITSVGVLGASLATVASGPPPHTVQLQRGDPADRGPNHRAPTTARPEPRASTTTTTTPPTPATPRTAAIAPVATARPADFVAPPAPPPTPSPPATVLPSTWITGVGDDLWHVARHALVAVGHRDPTNTEIGRYWQRLIAANRDRVADPDLIYPGQILDLPPIEAD